MTGSIWRRGQPRSEIVADGFAIDAKVEPPVRRPSPALRVRLRLQAGLPITPAGSMICWLATLEIFGQFAAMLARIPVAHLCGGDVTKAQSMMSYATPSPNVASAFRHHADAACAFVRWGGPRPFIRWEAGPRPHSQHRSHVAGFIFRIRRSGAARKERSLPSRSAEDSERPCADFWRRDAFGRDGFTTGVNLDVSGKRRINDR